MIKHVSAFCLISVCIVLGACSRNSKPQGATNTPGSTEALSHSGGLKIFNYVNADEPKHLDPAFSYDTYEGIASGLIFDGLVLFDNATGIQPGLAEKWEVSPDGLTYTFHLRDAKFSDGRIVTADDVRYSFSRVLRPETNSDRKWLFDKIVGSDDLSSGTTKELSGLKTPDAKTVVITLKRPYPAFLTKLAMPSAAIVPNGAAGTDKPDPKFETSPIGSGPWVLQRWAHDQRMEFHRNENYWGEKPGMEKFFYNIQTDDDIQRRQFDAGNFDYYVVGFAVYKNWLGDPRKRERMMPVQEMNTYFLAFMNSKPKFADKRVRQAIAHAIDVKTIFKAIQMGRGELAHGPVPPGIEGYRKDIQPRKYDPELAKKLLAEAGVKDLTIDFWYSTDQQSAEILSQVAGDLEKVGIKSNLNRRDLPSFREGINNGTPDMYWYNWWLDYPDIENAIVPTFHSRNIPRGGNGSHYKNSELDRLLGEADNEIDPKKRIEKYQQAEDFVIEECPWVFMWHRKVFEVVQPWVKNYHSSIMYNAHRFTGVDIDMSQRPHQ